jgi:hypothetical protein
LLRAVVALGSVIDAHYAALARQSGMPSWRHASGLEDGDHNRAMLYMPDGTGSGQDHDDALERESWDGWYHPYLPDPLRQGISTCYDVSNFP